MTYKIADIIKYEHPDTVFPAEETATKIRQQIGREFIGTFEFELSANNPSGESLMELMEKFFQLENNDD